MDGFARRREQSKEEIRRAAWELFSQFGVDKVSIADIARKAGVSQATIYNNFGSKETLAREFVSAAVEDLSNRVLEVLASEQEYRDKMAAFIRFLSQVMAEGKASAADHAIFTGSQDLLNDPEIKKVRVEAQERLIRLLLGMIEEGKQHGEVNPELSKEALTIYFGMFMDLFTRPDLQYRFSHRPKLVRELGTLMIHGLGVEQK